jgi:acetolactate synthase-1/2/3 large subunit
VLNVIGDHATWHLPADPLLATDVESLAYSVSDSVKKSLAATTVAFDLAEAIEATMTNGGCVATLIVPHDAQKLAKQVTAFPCAACATRRRQFGRSCGIGV